MKPYQSLLEPDSEPSGRTTTQEIAPIFFAVMSTSSTIRMASCLSGMVRLQPEKFSAGSARSALVQPLRRDRQRHVAAGKPMLGEPEIVQHRRARLRDRPAHHGGEQETVG